MAEKSETFAIIKAAESLSTGNKGYSTAIGKIHNYIIDPGSMKEIKARLSKVEIDESIAVVETVDKMKNAEVIPYYKNTKERIWSLFKNAHEDILLINDINTLLINAIPNSRAVWIDYTTINNKDSLIKTKSKGDCAKLNSLARELVFVLRLKPDIDYENASYKGASKLLKFILKMMMDMRNGVKKTFIIEPEEHKVLQRELAVRDETLAYKAICQTVILLMFHYKFIFDGEFSKNITSATDPEGKNTIIIRRTMGDIKGIEPFYQWNIVLSPEEKKVLIECLGKDIFAIQNKLLSEFRKPSQPKSAEIASQLNTLTEKVKTRVGNSYLSIIYGRLKVYHAAKNDSKMKQLFIKDGKPRDLSYPQVLDKIVKEQKVFDLFCEDITLGIILKEINNGQEIRDLSVKTRYDEVPRRTYYEFDEIKHTKTIRDLVMRSRSKPSAKIWLNQIKNRTPAWSDKNFNRIDEIDAKVTNIESQEALDERLEEEYDDMLEKIKKIRKESNLRKKNAQDLESAESRRKQKEGPSLNKFKLLTDESDFPELAPANVAGQSVKNPKEKTSFENIMNDYRKDDIAKFVERESALSSILIGNLTANLQDDTKIILDEDRETLNDFIHRISMTIFNSQGEFAHPIINQDLGVKTLRDLKNLTYPSMENMHEVIITFERDSEKHFANAVLKIGSANIMKCLCEFAQILNKAVARSESTD
jgi:hypothetical protein